MTTLSPKELFAARSKLFESGKCPVCSEQAQFKHTGTKAEGNSRLRVMQCPHCGSTFRVHVRVELSFCKVTKEAEADR
ncbi:MAG: hypothetical protein HGB35_00095 [Geobacteraceae bacterium]|nr:hypothetical protein [Geobacteraceae bacterium]